MQLLLRHISPCAPGALPISSRARWAPRTKAVPPGSTGNKVDPAELLDVARKAAYHGSEVVMHALDKPRKVDRKLGLDIVTETDKAAEEACITTIKEAFPEHATLGEEGGISGNAKSDYLWCIDPLDGTVNFANGYPGFCVSVGVLRHATPVAGCVVMFVGGPGAWTTRTYKASRNNGAFCDGQRIIVSRTKGLNDAVLATELAWYPEMWPHLAQLHKQFTQQCRGIRMSGAAAANLCHLAHGSIDAYWQFNLKPWDVAAGLVILEEAGGVVTTADGAAYSAFDRSLVASNGSLHDQVLGITEPGMSAMLADDIDLSMWCIPRGYRVRAGAQLES